MLYGGLNQTSSLNALLEHLKTLKNPKFSILISSFRATFQAMAIYLLMKTIRKSRNFVPDQLTRLWLIHFQYKTNS